MDCVICAIAKLENRYIDEWISYHIELGFSHIYIYDNNDCDGENINDVIANKTYSNKVTVFDIRGKRQMQKLVYQDFYEKGIFDWCAFIDIDEFITFSNSSSVHNIEEYLSTKSDWNAIHVNWLCYGDCGKKRMTKAPVISRFKRPKTPISFFYSYYDIPENEHIKSIIKKGLPLNWTIDSESFQSNPHTPFGLTNICNPVGMKLENKPFAKINYDILFIRHYTTKTIEEYLDKVRRQCADCDNNHFYSFTKFFRINKPSIRKLIWIKKNCPTVRIRACLHEYFKFLVLNFNLPLRGLYKSL